MIIAAWNAAPSISTTIASVLDQTIRDIEIVVVDDGSTDATRLVVSAIADPRVRLVTQENRGQSAALNRGVRESNAEFIKFLDADDYLNARHIEAQLAAIDERPDVLASCRWGYFLDDPTQPWVRPESVDRDYDEPKQWIIDSLTRDEGMMGGWLWLIPRSVWDRAGGWNESLSLNNDFDFSIRLVLSSRGVRFAADAVYAYREGVQGALSGRRSRAAMESAFQTTLLGCNTLLAHDSSGVMKAICADRWQLWLHAFYPEFPDLARRAETEVKRLGGSSRALEGGRLLRLLLPFLGWKLARRLQIVAYSIGWKSILQLKTNRRLRMIRRGGPA